MVEVDDDLERRLRDAETEELHGLLRRRATELDVPSALGALRNPFIGREGIEAVAGQGRLLASYELKRQIALHPRSPEPLALRFVPSLFWRDLLELGLDTRVRPTVRRAADRRLIGRLLGARGGREGGDRPPRLAAGARAAAPRPDAPGGGGAAREPPVDRGRAAAPGGERGGAARSAGAPRPELGAGACATRSASPCARTPRRRSRSSCRSCPCCASATSRPWRTRAAGDGGPPAGAGAAGGGCLSGGAGGRRSSDPGEGGMPLPHLTAPRRPRTVDF